MFKLTDSYTKLLLRKLKDLSDHEAACIHRKAIIIIRQKREYKILI